MLCAIWTKESDVLQIRFKPGCISIRYDNARGWVEDMSILTYPLFMLRNMGFFNITSLLS